MRENQGYHVEDQEIMIGYDQQENEGDLQSENGVVQVLGKVADVEDEDVIDIDNPDDLAAKGLRRIQIDGEEEEYLMDLEGNIYDL